MMSIKDGVVTGELSEICQKHIIWMLCVCVCVFVLIRCFIPACVCVKAETGFTEKAGLQLSFGN